MNFNAKGGDAMMGLNEKVERVDIEGILKAIGSRIGISGALINSAGMQGRGHDPIRFRQGLKGKLALALVLRDLKLQKIFAQAFACSISLSRRWSPEALIFPKFQAPRTLADSVLRSRDLLVKSLPLSDCQ